MYVGQVYFYEGNFGRKQGIADSHAGMGESGRIDNYEIDAAVR